MRDTFHTEPADLATAAGDTVQTIRLGRSIGLGVSNGVGAAMATLTPDEARTIAAELVRLLAELT